ncbi:uncharacterized protein LOC128387043 [Panonychus citri]|uniref:uncharacterized protein LOC128387043 n=1 Tax=Panonychus citri TaxID=50023 RepID=UPI002306F8BE|nr:uncharacterized protein LOC128387043 [Panonychus citri]
MSESSITIGDYISDENNRQHLCEVYGLKYSAQGKAYTTKVIREAMTTQAFICGSLSSYSSPIDKNLPFDPKFLDCPEIHHKLRSSGITEENLRKLIKEEVIDEGKNLSEDYLKELEFTSMQIKRYFDCFSEKDDDQGEVNDIDNDEPNHYHSPTPNNKSNKNQPINQTPINSNQLFNNSIFNPAFFQQMFRPNSPSILDGFKFKSVIEEYIEKGSLTFCQWLNKLERRVSLLELSDQLAIKTLCAQVTDDIHKAIDEIIKNNPNISFSNLVKRVRESFVGEREVAEATEKLFNKKFIKGTNPSDYVFELTEAARLVIPKIPDKGIIFLILHLLPNELSFSLRHNSNVNTLDKLTKFLIIYSNKIKDNSSDENYVPTPNNRRQNQNNNNNRRSNNYSSNSNSNFTPNKDNRSNRSNSFNSPNSRNKSTSSSNDQNNSSSPNNSRPSRGRSSNYRGRGRSNNQQSRPSQQQNNQQQSTNFNNAQDSNNSNTNNNNSNYCSFCTTYGHSTANCQAKIAAETTNCMIHLTNNQINMRPRVTIKLDHPDVANIDALLDSGAGSTFMRKDLAIRLKIPIYQSHHEFLGLSGRSKPVRAVGVTQLVFRVENPEKLDPLRVFVLEELPLEMILGKNFWFWSNSALEADPVQGWKPTRSGKPLKVTLMIPGPACFHHLFTTQFPKIYGPARNYPPRCNFNSSQSTSSASQSITTSNSPSNTSHSTVNHQQLINHQSINQHQSSNSYNQPSTSSHNHLNHPNQLNQHFNSSSSLNPNSNLNFPLSTNFNQSTINQQSSHFNQHDNHVLLSDEQYLHEIKKAKLDTRRDEFPQEISDLQSTLIKGISSNLNQHQKSSMINFLNKFKSVFSTHKYDLGCIPAEMVNIKIDIGNHSIPKCNPYRLGPKKREILDKKIKELMENNIIEPSNSCGGSPAFLVEKPNGKDYRLVTSFKELNSIMKTRSYPMPNIDDHIQALAGYEYFITIDFAQGFHQIQLNPCEREKVALVTEMGKFQYVRLPMGLADSPAYFQQFVNSVFGDLLYKACLAYIDDIVIFGRSFEELINNADAVFTKIKNIGLKVQPDKCKWGHKEVKFLGHIISGKTVRPDPEKIQRLKEFQPPKNVKGLQSQLGLFNYLSKFIPNYSTVASILFELCSKKNKGKFNWDRNHQKAWQHIKDSLIKDCLLSQFKPEAQHKLMVDASSIAVGGILLQLEDNEWRAVSYFGQKLAKYQLAYTITEKECLAVIVAVNKYSHYLSGKSFTIVSDHCALCALPKINFKCARLHRWASLMSQYDYKIEYSKGETHPADCFSRSSEWRHKKIGEINEEDYYKYLLFAFEDNCHVMCNDLHQAPHHLTHNYNWMEKDDTIIKNFDCDDIQMINEENKYQWILFSKQVAEQIGEKLGQPEIIDDKLISKFIVTGDQLNKPDNNEFDNSNEIKKHQSKDNYIRGTIRQLSKGYLTKHFVMKHGILHRKLNNNNLVIVLPASLQEKVFSAMHTESIGGHFGVKSTTKRIKELFWFPQMEEWIKSKIDNCDVCLSFKHPTTNNHRPHQMPIPLQPLDRLQIDIVGKFHPSSQRNEYLFTAVDYFTKFVFAQPTRNQKENDAIKFVKYIIQFIGHPKIIQVDNGPCFRSNGFKEFCEQQKIKLQFTTPYRPQSNGLIERLNGILGNRINMFTVIPKDWDKWITEHVLSYNSAHSENLQTSPYFLLFGKLPNTPLLNELEIQPTQTAKEELQQLRNDHYQRMVGNQQNRLDLTDPKPLPFKVGDRVKVSVKIQNKLRGKKLTAPYKGDYIVIEVYDSAALIIGQKGPAIKVNFENLKLAGDRNEIEDLTDQSADV